jgi:hypothetical protein
MKAIYSILASCICLLLSGEASAQNYVGVILEGYKRGCKITSSGESRDCSDQYRYIFVGDIIEKNPSVRALKIKWAPNAYGKDIDDRHVRAALSQPPEISNRGFIDSIKSYIENFVKPASHKTTGAVTRNISMQNKCEYILTDQFEQLPVNATLLSGMPITLSWFATGVQSVSVFDNSEKKVFEKSVGGKSKVSFTPEEASIKHGEKYTWSREGHNLSERYRFRMLDPDAEKEVREGLQRIDSEKGSPSAKAIRKATFLQMLSDAYPDRIDMYWLSLQDLPAKFSGVEEARAICGLKLRHANHSRDQKP